MPRPRVTLSYAQSLDGSVAAVAGQPLALSGPEALAFTHYLRAMHDAILVGIGTVLADDPRLTARGVATPARQPQPIVLDSRLRCPLDARLLAHPRPPWIITTPQADAQRQAELEARGARIIRLPPNDQQRVSLPGLLDWLGQADIASLMVEGGSGILSSFLLERLADRVAITIAPRFVGGLRAVNARCDLPLRNVYYHMLGPDVIVEGDLG